MATMTDRLDTDNPFRLLAVNATFEIDEAELDRAYLRASAATHPDRFTDPVEQARAADRAAAVNKAYRQLKDPEQRANTLLDMLGGPGPGDDKSLPDGLLLEMLEAREHMDEARANGDESELASLEAWAVGRRDETLRRIADHFAALLAPDAPGDPAARNAIRTQLNALRYYQRMIEQIDPHYVDPER